MEVATPNLTRLLGVAACALVVAGCGKGVAEQPAADERPADEVVLTPEAGAEGRLAAEQAEAERAAEAQPEQPTAKQLEDAPSPGAPTDAEVRAELREARAALIRFRRYLDTAAFLPTGPRARVLPDGRALAPDNAPDIVKRVIMAGNAIAKFPYKWGGGHGAWRDTGYDCSGSVSFALAAAGLLDRPMTSGQFMGYGAEGPGEWITLYANQGHIFMVVAGLRFDTSGRGRAGTRWQEDPRGVDGFAIRHIPGL
jgi:cell wall-associated NlpC family hydrolase